MKHFVTLIIPIFLVLMMMQTVTGQQAGEIHKAVAAGELYKVQTLIEADSSLLELKDSNGNTPLNLACLNGFSRESVIAKLLIEKGANVNTKNNMGWTPLHGACVIAGSYGSDFDLAKLLIARGADINPQDKYGRTPLYCAASSFKTAWLLIENGADVNAGSNVLHQTLMYESDDELSKLLIKKGFKLNQKDKLGNTELHLAAMRGFTDAIRLLVKYGSEVNAINNGNHTALYYAAKHGYHSSADVLIASGADKSTIIETNYGKAPQLSEPLKQGEAYLWYMKMGGYVVKTKNHLLLLSPFKTVNASPEAGFVNGQVTSKELAGQNIIVLASYPREDFPNSDLEKISKVMPKFEWMFYSDKPAEINKDLKGLPPYHLIGPGGNLSYGEIRLHTTPQIPGVGFLYEVDGVKIFDGKMYFSTNEAKQAESYRRGIDSLKSFGPIDIAILGVRNHMNNSYEPYLYLIDQLSPKTVYLVEGVIDPEEYSRCAKFLRSRNIEVKYPETNAIAGDRFHYLRD
ncbi:MAG TPA: ankyrin repeat domain-containing protein [Bacteroidales bacterium]